MAPVSDKSARLLKNATSASVFVALFLILGKLGTWLLTGSVSVLASLVDSLMDAAASIINLIAVRWSLLPADKDHRHGHGKAESLAGLAQASFIAGSALFLVVHAFDRLRYPTSIHATRTGIIMMTAALIITVLLLLYQHYVIRRTNSTAIRADALHYATDVLTNLGTILALFLAARGWPILDPLIAMLIAVYIFYSACRIGYEATQLLMDRELPNDIRAKIKEIALTPSQVKGVHDIRTRLSGQIMMVQLHLELEDTIPLVRAHGVAKAVEKEILRIWPEADVIIHQDPVHLLRKTGEQVDRD